MYKVSSENLQKAARGKWQNEVLPEQRVGGIDPDGPLVGLMRELASSLEEMLVREERLHAAAAEKGVVIGNSCVNREQTKKYRGVIARTRQYLNGLCGRGAEPVDSDY